MKPSYKTIAMVAILVMSMYFLFTVVFSHSISWITQRSTQMKMDIPMNTEQAYEDVNVKDIVQVMVLNHGNVYFETTQEKGIEPIKSEAFSMFLKKQADRIGQDKLTIILKAGKNMPFRSMIDMLDVLHKLKRYTILESTDNDMKKVADYQSSKD